MSYGIDRLVEDKKDAYRSNPAALQQRSRMSKELTDLLALEQITKERDEISRDMQLRMQQQPGTIAQQLEQKAVGQRKDEIVKGVAGVMKNNQARQQANMQRIASAGSPQGLAAQPRPNMQRMAQGGIVGFRTGGQAQADEIAEIRARTDIDESTKYQMIQAILGKPGYKDPATLDDDAAKAQKVRAARDIARDPKAMNPALGFDALKSGPTRMVGGDYKDRGKMNVLTQGMQGNVLGTGALQGRGQTPPQAVFGMGDEYDDEPPAAQPPPVKPPVAAGINTLDSGLGQVDAPAARTKFLDPAGYAVKMSDASSTDDTLKGIKGLMKQDPKAARDDALAYGLDKLGMSSDRVAAEKARQDALAALDARQLDPKKLQQEQLSAFLRGTAKAGSFAGGSQGLADVRAQQELAERNRLLGRQGIERSFEDEQQRIREKAFSSAQEAYKIANENVRSGVSSMTQFNRTQVGMLSDNAKSKLQAETANMEAEDRDARRTLDAAINNASQEVKVAVANLEAETSDRKMNLQAELDMLKIEQLDRGKAEDTLSKVAKYMGDVRSKYEKIYQDRIANLPMGTDQSVVQALREEMNSAIIISLKPLADRAKDIEARIAGTYGDPSSGLSYEGTD